MLDQRILPSEEVTPSDLREIRRAYEGSRTQNAHGLRVFALALFCVLAVIVASALLSNIFQPVSERVAPNMVTTT